MQKLEVRTWGKEEKIALITNFLRRPQQLGAIAIHIKEDGAFGDLPSILFECKDAATNVYYHELSLETLNAALVQGGYCIKEFTKHVGVDGDRG